jgi:hypothetical protein
MELIELFNVAKDGPSFLLRDDVKDLHQRLHKHGNDFLKILGKLLLLGGELMDDLHATTRGEAQMSPPLVLRSHSTTPTSWRFCSSLGIFFRSSASTPSRHRALALGLVGEPPIYRDNGRISPLSST